MSKLRVLHVFKTYFPDSYGGVEQTIKQICLGTSKLGVENRILTLSSTPKPSILTQPEAEIHRFQLNIEIASTGFSFSAIKGYHALSTWADIIHYHFPWPFADLLHLLNKKPKPSILTYHSDIIRQKTLLKLYRPLMNYYLNSINKIVATSPNYLESSVLLNQFRHKTSVIPIGLDQSSYPATETARIDMWRNKFGSDFFLFVGVLRYYKGLHILLEAIKDTNFKVVIIGSGPTETELKTHANELNLKNVVFLGSLPDEDKVALFQLCTAVVFPSHLRSEAYGLSLLEGAMYGKPLISCEIGTGSSYINLHEVSGLVIPPNHPQALRTAMQRLIDNEEERLQMGKNANLRFRDFFQADHMAGQYMDLYLKLVSSIA